MIRKYSAFLFGLLVCAGAQAATVNTTMTLTGSGALTGTTFTGTANLTGIGMNLPLTGTFSTAGSGFLAAVVITINSTDKLNVSVTIPSTIILTGSGTASATVTGGTGAYAGATGSFPSVPGTGSLSGTTLTLTFSGPGTITTSGTGGGGGGTPTPTVTAVLDAASNAAGIAQGSIFIVKGSNLSASGFTSFPPPRPTSSSGVKITFTPAAGGSGTDAYLVYLYNQSGVNQLAAILPSTVAPGNYNVTVTSGGATSAPFAAQVVATKIALFTQDNSGTGLASVQNYISPGVVDLNRLTTGSVSGVTISPAKPGQAVIAYGTGLGPYAAGDNTASPAFDFRSSMQIQAVVGGVTIPVDYAGRAGYAGEDQINFTLPANIPTGCAVSLQISVNGKLSAPTSIAIAPDSSSNACVFPGYTSDQLKKLDQGGTITVGGFGITQFQVTVPSIGSVKSNAIAGGFAQLTGYQLSSAVQTNVSVIQQGSCQIVQSTTTGSASGGGSLTYLDAGNITVNGPAGSSLTNQLLNKSNNTYSLSSTEGFSIAGQTSFSLPAGTYSLNGAGGNDVGAFNASITIGSPLTITGGLPPTVNRSTGLTLNWTGGNSSDLVEIVGGASTTTGSGSTAVTTSTTFFCLTTAGKGTFTVPASILQQIPATSGSNQGLLEVASGVTSTFTAPLKADSSIVAGALSSFVGIGATPSYQ
jgi:uncharacterized protein (TIGR03437 family)